MIKSKAQKDILYISISSFILVVLWIASNLYHAYVTSTVTPELQNQIQQINPNFDIETVQKLKTRQIVNPAYEFGGASASATITPEPTAQTAPSPATTPPAIQPSGIPVITGQ
jgi:ABC-type lipoprotein release transport system permease subunit